MEGEVAYRGIPAGIAGIGHAVPARVVSNRDLEARLDTSDDWIRRRTGVVERRWLADGERPSDLLVAAGERALADAGVAREEVELLVVATVSGDFTAPSAACVVQERLGLPHCGAFDVAAACSGFLYALATGAGFVAGGKVRKALVIGGEAMSRMLDSRDRSTAVLFGDGAGAALLRPHAECGQGLIEDWTLGADGAGAALMQRPRGGCAAPLTVEALRAGEHLIRMEGRALYRAALERLPELVAWGLDGRAAEELDLLLLHQLNLRLVEAVAQRAGVPLAKVPQHVERYGNTSSGSLPILLSESVRDGRLRRGDLALLVAFGAGLTWGAVRIRW